jgi:hypothetical protein
VKNCVVCLTKPFKFRSACRQLNSHVGCDFEPVMIFRFFCRIPWTPGFTQTWCGERKKLEHCTFRQLWIFLKKTAPEFNPRIHTEFLFQPIIRCNIYQALVIFLRDTIRSLLITIWISDPGTVNGGCEVLWNAFCKTVKFWTMLMFLSKSHSEVEIINIGPFLHISSKI